MTNRTMYEVVDQFIDENKLHRTEGRKGVENLCRLVRAIGYKDEMYFWTIDIRCVNW